MTTIEILAPYLPYDVEVETPSGRMKVFAMDKWSISATYPKGDNTGFEVGYDEISPVLFGFADLCTPLADGTVPAVEAIRLAFGWPKSFYIDRFIARHAVALDEQYVRIESFPSNSGGWIRLDNEHASWLFDGFDMPNHKVVNPLAAHAYLRRNHFAVGLTSDQYIRKQAV